MNTTITARNASHAYDAYRQQRRVHTAFDRISDAVIASGALLLTNALLPLGFNLPAGRIGITAGGALIAAGIAWMRRPVRARHEQVTYEPVAQLATVTPIHRAQHAA